MAARDGHRRPALLPEMVGSHWAPDSQVDVVAVSWQEQAILLGKCRWWPRPLSRVVRELLEKAPPGVPDEGWQVHYALFARTRFTDAAAALADDSGALLGVPAYSVRVTLPIWRKTPASTPVCRASARLSSCKGTISAMGAVAGQAEGSRQSRVWGPIEPDDDGSVVL